MGDGELSSSTDVDAYWVNAVPPGMLDVILLNRSNPDEDFLLEVYYASGAPLLASDTMVDGLASIHRNISTSAPYCIRISGSEGGYTLLASATGSPPTISGLTSMGGTPITFAAPGTTVKILGNGFTAGSHIHATFGGARALLLGATNTQVTVKIPVQAADGEVFVSNSLGRSEGFGFNVGVPSPPLTWFTQPDSTFYDDSLGYGIFLNRTLLGFGYDVDLSSVESRLNAAQALDTSRTGWIIAGELPELNTYVVEWSFSGSPTVADLEDLLVDIEAQGGLLFAEMEQVGELSGLAVPSDFDLYVEADRSGALAQINFEEARRLYWLSGLPAPTQVDIYIPDTGLNFGSATWGVGIDELPADRFSLYELVDHGGWAQTAAEGHFTYIGDLTNHGNSVAGLIGAASQRDPDWSDGAARSSDNASGVLSSFEVFAVDDDGVLGVDQEGEWGPATITVFNVAGSDTDSEGSLTPQQEWAAWRAMGALPEDHPGIISSSSKHRPTDTHLRADWPGIVREICGRRPIFQAAGNNGADVEDVNILATSLAEACPGKHLVVGGTIAGTSDADEPHGQTNYGDEVGILAPYSGWFVATTTVTSTGFFAPTYHSFGGTSAATPAVASAYALLRGFVPETTANDAALLALLVNTGDDISPLYSLAGSKQRLNLFSALWEGIRLAGGQPAMAQGPQIFVADYADDKIVAQDIDPATGLLSGAALEIDALADGCDGPTDVVVHPLGDVFYALCVDSGNIVAWTTNTWTLVGELYLEGTVATYTEMAIAQDGILRVGTISGGTAQVESFDTWNGTRHIEAELISSAANGQVYGADVNPADGLTYAFGATDYSATAPHHNALVELVPDRLGRGPSTITTEDFTSFPNTMRLRDVAWFSDGSSVVGEFYGSSTSTLDKELAFVSSSSTATATINNCEEPLGIAMDPVMGSGLGWVACQTNKSVVEVDLSVSGPSYTPATTLYLKATSTASSTSYPVFVEAAQNGAFIVVGSYSSSSSVNYVYVIPWTVAAGGGSVYSGSYDAVGATFNRPRGVAITPMLSIATPRPGVQVAGIKRFHIIVRDPSIEEIVYNLDGSTVCTDTELWDGSSEDCLINTRAWPPGEHVITVVANGGASGDFSISATYSTNL
jgi:hypothetical protein